MNMVPFFLMSLMRPPANRPIYQSPVYPPNGIRPAPVYPTNGVTPAPGYQRNGIAPAPGYQRNGIAPAPGYQRNGIAPPQYNQGYGRSPNPNYPRNYVGNPSSGPGPYPRRPLSLQFETTRVPGIPIRAGWRGERVRIRQFLRHGFNSLVEGCSLERRTRRPCNSTAVTKSQCERWFCCWDPYDRIPCAKNKFYFTKYEKCGLREQDKLPNLSPPLGPLISSIINGRIIGGNDAVEGDWPWVAYIFVKPVQFIGALCGGSLLNKRWIVTAAHCFGTTDPTLYGVVLGEHTRSVVSPNEELRNVMEIKVHPNFNLANFKSDIALVKLDKPVGFNKYISPICLVPQGTPTDSATEPTFTNALCKVAGWGLTSSGGIRSDVLQELTVEIKEKFLCNFVTVGNSALYNNRAVALDDPQFCAGGVLGQDSCMGDSGGPLMCRHPDGTYFLHGIVSYGTEACALMDLPAVYTKVGDFSDWIGMNIY